MANGPQMAEQPPRPHLQLLVLLSFPETLKSKSETNCSSLLAFRSHRNPSTCNPKPQALNSKAVRSGPKPAQPWEGSCLGVPSAHPLRSRAPRRSRVKGAGYMPVSWLWIPEFQAFGLLRSFWVGAERLRAYLIPKLLQIQP